MTSSCVPAPKIVIGIDEAGKGAIAGPLVVAATAFLEGTPVPAVTWQSVRGGPKQLVAGDSKGFKSHEQRQLIAGEIRRVALHSIVVRRSSEEIDARLMYAVFPETVRLAASRVMEALRSRYPDPRDYVVYVDGEFEVNPGDFKSEVIAVPRGDKDLWQVGAASILAKTEHDEEMLEMAEKYPEFSFEKNMGYPTAAHRAFLMEKGPTPIHRKSFATTRQAREHLEGPIMGLEEV